MLRRPDGHTGIQSRQRVRPAISCDCEGIRTHPFPIELGLRPSNCQNGNPFAGGAQVHGHFAPEWHGDRQSIRSGLKADKPVCRPNMDIHYLVAEPALAGLFTRRHVAGAVPNSFLNAREKAASES